MAPPLRARRSCRRRRRRRCYRHRVRWSLLMLVTRDPGDLALLALRVVAAELVALDSATRELEFLRQVALDFGLKVELPVPMLQDNLSTIRIVESGRFSSRTRHLNVRYHYTHDLVKDGVVRIQKIDTKFIPSGALTKALESKDYERHALVLLGMAAIEGV